MSKTATALPGTLCCICGRSIAVGERVLRFHLPSLVALMLSAEEHSLAWLHLCCDCIYLGYALFDYGMYDFDPEKEARLAALVDRTLDTLVLRVEAGVWSQVCGRCQQPLTGPVQVHEGVGLCQACAAVIAPSRPTDLAQEGCRLQATGE